MLWPTASTYMIHHRFV